LRLFLEVLLKSSTRYGNPYPPEELFTLVEVRTATCKARPTIDWPHPRPIRNITSVQIRKDLYEASGAGSISELVAKWSTTGIVCNSAFACKKCDDKKKKKSINPHYLIQKSLLSCREGSKPPQHLYFDVDVDPLVHLSLQREFMGHLDWPFQLSFHGATYTLFSRGYWNGSHYWCKVLKNIGGTSGVWLHDKRENAGIARMINRDPPAIAGQSPDTTSLFHSRAWTPSEEEYVVNSIAKITSANPDAPGTVPFAHLGNLLKLKPITDPNKVVVPNSNQSANKEPLANIMYEAPVDRSEHGDVSWE
jgi:hypothetical protein